MDQCRLNERGDAVVGWHVGGSRFRFDFVVCSPKKGWVQYDTDQDGAHFGVWGNVEQRTIITFAEGDFTRVLCVTTDTLERELVSMEESYGPPPPAFRGFDMAGVITNYDERPTVRP